MDSYCPAPWIGINVLPEIITPCCQWSGTCVDASTVDTIEQSISEDGFEHIRKDMLEGKPIKNCEQCYNAEKIGAHSERLYLIEKYGRPTDVSLKQIDINFDNICNIKCRGCQSTSSHLWTSDEKLIYGKPYVEKKYPRKDVTINLDSIERISVSGGEPFLSTQFNELAEYLLENGIEKQLEITVDTNATVLPSTAIQELFLKSKTAIFSVSMDGIGSLQEYYRSGSNFDKCISNIHYFVNMLEQRNDNTQVNIHTTVNVYNVNKLQEIKDFFEKEFDGKTTFSHRILYWPEQMSIRNLPEDYKQTLLKIVKEFDDQFSDVIQELEMSGKNYFDHFINFHNILDSSRKENVSDANPLLAEYISNYNSNNTDSKEFFNIQYELLRQ